MMEQRANLAKWAVVCLALMLVLGVAAGLAWEWADRGAASEPSPQRLQRGVSVESANSSDRLPASPGRSQQRAVDTPRVRASLDEVRDPEVLRVSVLTPEGNPVQAEVELRSMEGRDLKARQSTDSNGELAVLLDLDPTTLVVTCSKEGFRTERRRIDFPEQSAVEIMLWRSGSIHGVVPAGSGVVIPAGLTAYAWPASMHPSPNDFADEGDATSFPLSRGEVGEDGSFVIDQVAEGVEHVVVIAGGDRISSRHTSRAGGFASVPVARMYGAIIRLEEEAGSSVKTSPAVFGAGMSWSPVNEHVASLGIHRVELAATYASHSIASFGGGSSSRRQLLLFTGEDDVGDAVRVDFACDLPGYAELECTIDIPGLREEAVKRVVHVREVATAWGWIRVAFRCPDLESFSMEGDASGRLLGVLGLTATDGTNLEVRVQFGSLLAPMMLRVPAGEYIWRFESSLGSFVYPDAGSMGITVPLESATGDEDIADALELNIDLEGFTVLALEASSLPGEREYRGTLRLEFTPNRSASSVRPVFRYFFRGPPYLVTGLPSGEYDLRVVQPATVSEGVDTVTVSPYILGHHFLKLVDKGI